MLPFPQVDIFECSTFNDALRTLQIQDSIDRIMSKSAYRLIFCPLITGNILHRLDINLAIIDAVSLIILLREWHLTYMDQLSHVEGPSYEDYVVNSTDDQSLTPSTGRNVSRTWSHACYLHLLLMVILNVGISNTLTSSLTKQHLLDPSAKLTESHSRSSSNPHGLLFSIYSHKCPV